MHYILHYWYWLVEQPTLNTNPLDHEQKTLKVVQVLRVLVVTQDESKLFKLNLATFNNEHSRESNLMTLTEKRDCFQSVHV